MFNSDAVDSHNRFCMSACIRQARKAVLCLGCFSVAAQLGCSYGLSQNAVHSPHRIMYTTAHAVFSLPYALAEQGGLAMIEGTVTLSNAWGLVVEDRTGGVWVDYLDDHPKYSPGDKILVVGSVGPGKYTPRIGSPSIRLISHGPMPIPRRVSFQQLTSGQEDAQYVSIEGIVRAVKERSTIEGFDGVTLSIAMPEGRVDAILPSQYWTDAFALVDAKVRISATALCLKNDNMQARGVILGVSDFNQITIIRPASREPFSAPLVPIRNIMRYRSGTDYFHRIRIRGVLTYYEPGTRLMLQDGTQAIEVFSADSPSLQIGDRVEAAGLPAPDDSGPIVRDALLRRLSRGAPIAPVPLTLQDASSSKYRFCLVSTEMHLLRVIDEPARTMLLLERGNQVTTAELEPRITAPPQFLVPGSLIRISGINVLSGEMGLNYGGDIRSRLLLRTWNDAALVTAASWWTTTRLFRLAIVLGSLVFGVLLLLLYVQLKRWKMEAVLRERERLAHDIHDTLAQSFAGIGFQLQVIRRCVAANDPASMHNVDVARKLVQFSHREARRSLNPTHPEGLPQADLLAALRTSAQGFADNGAIAIVTNASGTVHPVSAKLTEQLFRIGQEAISNAIRHAEPTSLKIHIDYRVDSICLTVNDNGRGFTISGDLLGFGIRGMRKRASEIGGELNITSSPENGTCVSVTVPSRGQKGLHSSLAAGQKLLNKILEQKRHAKSRP